MKIELIKMKVEDEYFSYKYKPLQYCCDELKNNRGIIFTDEDFVDNKEEYRDEDGNIIPQLCVTVSEVIGSYDNGWEEIYSYPIRFCPHCGEKINIEVVEQIDVIEKVKNLNKTIKELQDIRRKTDSKKEELLATDEIYKLNDKIDYFYEVREYEE